MLTQRNNTNITRIDLEEKKIYFEIQGDDFWEQSLWQKV